MYNDIVVTTLNGTQFRHNELIYVLLRKHACSMTLEK